jgi:pyridoxal phosphate-dependent aminotransferase EpsN
VNGIGADDEVITSSLTFAATAFAIRYVGARPVFIDSRPDSWNLDPALLDEWLERRSRTGKLPRAVLPVHLYGQSCDMNALVAICDRWGLIMIEDAAEALGASYGNRAPGSFGSCGVWSFNGNKMITTSGGGMFGTNSPVLAAHVRKLATQAREPAPHYQHEEIGYNYRLSNICAAIGRAQLKALEDRVMARRNIFEQYRRTLTQVPGITFAPEMSYGRHTRWLTCIQVDPMAFGSDREALRLILEAADIEARPVWKPMHEQPVFQGFEMVGGAIASRLFRDGLCLPSGSAMSTGDVDRVTAVILAAATT